MSALSRNTTETRKMIKSIATLTGLDPKAVETVIKTQELYILQEVLTQYKNNKEEVPSIELPYIGELKMFPITYKNRTDIPDNAAVRVKLYPDDKFKRRIRKSMFQEKDFLTEQALDSYKDTFVQRFQSLI
ncbi:hypothetical protein LIS04_138 [Listeria phage LIS04]|nr:hypothetical protein LIS04_138 [Listeria phage LIS04]